MGNSLLSGAMNYFIGTGNTFNIILQGLDNSGKTTFKYLAADMHDRNNNRLNQNSRPYKPYQKTQVRFQDVIINLYQENYSIRKIKQNDSICQGIIYMIDASDVQRFEKSKIEMFKVLQRQNLTQKPILVFFNKIDKAICTKQGTKDQIDKLKQQIENELIKTKRPFKIQMCSIAKRVGLRQGFQWLSNTLKQLK